METLIKNANAYIENKFQTIDILLRNDKIAKLGQNLSTTGLTQEFPNKLILPGVIDSQVHFRDPGLTHKEDLRSGSLSALHGGITTFLEMPNTNPSTTTIDAINHKLELANEKCVTNYGFFVGATGKNLNQLIHATQLPGCCGVKIFLGSSTGDLLLYDEEKLIEIFKNIKAPIALHSENELRLRERLHIKRNAKSAHDHPVWRDVNTALSSTKRIIEIARKAQKKIHVLHISTQEEIEFLSHHKDICTVEVLPQHLTLSAPDCYDRLGSYAQMNPPIREQRHQDALWEGIKNGTVDIIGSDHAPHTKEEKDRGFPNSPSGMPGVQTLLPLMLNHVNNGKLSLDRLIELVCKNPAKLYSLNKGIIREGRDADLTIIDMNQKHTFTNEEMKTKSGWTPFKGMRIQGIPTDVFVMGKHHNIL